MTKPVAEVLEDLEWLDSTGVGAIEAAERTEFPSSIALEKWLDRHDRYALWLRLKSRDPEGIHYERKKRPMQAVEAASRDHIATLLLQAEKSPMGRTRNKAKKIRALVEELTAALDADKDREQARREVERLERQLREAKARLSGGSGVVTPQRTGPAPAEVRTWARENGVDCPAMGRVPSAVMDAFLARQDGAA